MRHAAGAAAKGTFATSRRLGNVKSSKVRFRAAPGAVRVTRVLGLVTIPELIGMVDSLIWNVAWHDSAVSLKSKGAISRESSPSARKPRRLFRNFSKDLLPAVVITVLLGAAIASALTLFLTWLVLKIPPTGALPPPGPDGTSPFLDVLKVSLTVSAGIGGAVALVVAYRRQRHLEVDDAGRQSRYTSAAQQLGDSQAAVRLARVYAMANLADEWAEQRQQCVDVLCAYLRLPWSGDPTQIEPNTTTTEHTWPDGDGQRKVAKTYSGRAGEREVRQTIVRVIASYLRPDTGTTASHMRPDTGSIRGSGVSWSNLDIDLTNAALPNADFSEADFSGKTSFRQAQVSGYADFKGAIFSDHDVADFIRAQFSGDADFGGTKFSGIATWFYGTHFSGTANFWQARFPGEVSFDDALFVGDADFDEVQFSQNISFSAHFFNAQFRSDASFKEARLPIITFFDGTQFSGDADFTGAQFPGDALFLGTQFSRSANFDKTQFSDRASFALASIPSRSVFASARPPPSDEKLKEAVFRDEQPES
jgi:uncharacterized protein YjbI with pentapeptide repeats